VTPCLAPWLMPSPLHGVSNLDPSSDIVLSYSMPVSAVAGKFIRIVNDGGSGPTDAANPAGTGFRGENTINTLSIAANDTTQVSILGNKVTINPTSDLDLANRYHIEVDAGAFAAASGLASAAFNGASSLNFATVTPGRFDLGYAAASLKMASSGATPPTLVDSFKWLDLEGIGSQPSNVVPLNLATGSFALVFKDYNTTRPAGQPATYDGVDAPTFYVAANGFGADDRVYIDNQVALANDLGKSIFVHKGTAPTTVQFAPHADANALGGFIDVSLVGSTQVFTSVNGWMQQLGSTAAPMISG